MADFHPIQWAEKHPIGTAGIVFGGGLVVLFLMGAFSGNSSNDSGADAATSAYFNAEEAQGVAGDELQATQIEAQASTAQDLINANANENINTTWANADTTEGAQNEATEEDIAPYQAVASLGSDLAGFANAPNITTTSSNSTGPALFGLIPGSSSSTTTSKANPATTEAASSLGNLLGDFTSSDFSGFNPSS
jgi:hypothetical protein